MRTPLVASLVVVPALATAGPKAGTPAPSIAGKAPPACGVKMLPLVVGNEWTYTSVGAPQPAPEQIAKIAPPEPQTLHVEVKSVEKKGTETVVTLEEKTSTNISNDEKKPNVIERTLTTTITCGPSKFTISPDSVFFAAEPGGFYGMTIDKLDRKGSSWKVNATGALAEEKWEEDVAIQWSRHETAGSEAKLGAGKLDLERVYQPSQNELVITKLGKFTAEKIGLTTTGRVTLEGAAPDAKPSELPENWISLFWVQDSIGVVQMLNPYAHMYQLTDAKLK